MKVLIVCAGTTAQEVEYDPKPSYDTLINWKTNEQLYNHYIEGYLDEFGGNITGKAMAYYPYSPDLCDLAFMSMASDVRVNCGNDEVTGWAAKALNSGVYRYVITSWPSSTAHPFGGPFPANHSFHGWDMYAFFDTQDMCLSKSPEASDLKFATNVQTEIINFVKTGKPQNKNWKTYPQATALINTTLTFVPRHNQQQCEWWIKNDFFEYGWMN